VPSLFSEGGCCERLRVGKEHSNRATTATRQGIAFAIFGSGRWHVKEQCKSLANAKRTVRTYGNAISAVTDVL
jgi:hypothetical protein